VGQLWKQIDNKNQTVTFTYDALGRMKSRNEPGLNSGWLYDHASDPAQCASTKSCGQLVEAFTVDAGNNKTYRRLQSYDSVARPDTTSTVIDNIVHTSKQGYDGYGRLVSQTHQRGSSTARSYGYRYNEYGYLARLERSSGALWVATDQDAASRVTQALLGNSIQINRTYNPYSGRLTFATHAGNAGEKLREGYDYDALGNVATRIQAWNVNEAFSETFSYDELNRLRTSQVLGQAEQGFTYDAIGNLTSKTGMGIYTYAPSGANSVRPHAVQTVNGQSFGYDANGNREFTNGVRSATWTSFDMPDRLTKGTIHSTFAYGPEHQRTRQVRSDGTTLRYAGAIESEEKAGQVTVKTYLPLGLGVEIDRPTATQSETRYTHVDRLGSVIGITDEQGVLVEKMAYDVWGKRRSTDGSNTADGIDGQVDNKGFTGHEMLDQLDLVHMNGRVYDPATARFISADPIIQDPEHSQSFNRYSYVWNNPTNLTDPTGFQTVGAGITKADLDAAKQQKQEQEARAPDMGSGEGDATGGEGRFRWAMGSPSGSSDNSSKTSAAGNERPSFSMAQALANVSQTVVGVRNLIDGGYGTCTAQAFSNGEYFKGVGYSVAGAGYGLANVFLLRGAGGAVTNETVAVTTRFADEAALATQEVGENVVYRSVDAAANVNYVGITNNLERRAAEHLGSKGISIRMIPGLRNLSRADARAVEQTLIEHHKLARNGGTLMNRINSISQSNPAYANALQRGAELLKQASYPGF
jgi:RHS repeat-associated protein